MEEEAEVDGSGSTTSDSLQLECTEDFDLSDLEPPPPPVPGTEILSEQIISRRHFLKQSLGVDVEPEFVPIEFAAMEDEETVEVRNPPLTKHAAEVIVATEGSWYYPPRNFDVTLKPKAKAFVPARKWIPEDDSASAFPQIDDDVS